MAALAYCTEVFELTECVEDKQQTLSISSDRDIPLHILVGTEETEEVGRSGE